MKSCWALFQKISKAYMCGRHHVIRYMESLGKGVERIEKG